MGLVCQASPGIPHLAAAPPRRNEAVGRGEAEQEAFDRRIAGYAARCAASWAAANDACRGFGATVSLATKLEHEHRADRYAEEMETMLRAWPASPAKRMTWREDLLRALRRMAGDYLTCDAKGLDRLFTAEALDATSQFIREARAFASAISDESLFQALRNLWVIHSVQLLLQTPIALTPATFAYSMLYPWTDNFLDDPRLASATKIAFSDWLALRLAGAKPAPQNLHSEQICRLGGMIERL